MAHEDFENIVKSRFQGFESAPPESVWGGINAVRAQRKKRVFWWLLPLLLIAVGASAFYAVNYSSDSQNRLNSTLTTINTIKNTDNQENTNNSTGDDIDRDLINLNPDNTAQKLSIAPGTTTKRALKQISNPSEKNTVTSTPEVNEPEETLQLTSMEALPIRIPTTDSEMQRFWFDGLSRQPGNLWNKSIGLQLGSFISVSEARTDFVPPITLFAEDASYGNATYQRFLEAAPYIEWKNYLTGFSLRGNLVYSAANISAATGANTFLGRQQSFGLGIGSGYAFVKRRFEASVYVQIQSEVLNTLYSNDGSYSWFAQGNSTQTQSIPSNSNAPAPPSYNQLALSGEVGLRGSYALRNPFWRLHFGAGYRNYFWQQEIAMPTNEAILELPQLLDLHFGVSYDL